LLILPEERQAQYAEEMLAEFYELPGHVQIRFAVSMVRGCLSVRRETAADGPTSQPVVNEANKEGQTPPEN
jgi:hypothetical protein